MTHLPAVPSAHWSPAADPAGSGGHPAAPDGRRWLVLGVLAVAQLMVVLDGTIVSIALPSAQRALHFSDSDRQWVVTAYALGFGSLLLLGGRLADLFGRRRLLLVGLAGFGVASGAGGAAGSLAVLLAARGVQGVFAAMLAPALLSLLTTTFAVGPDRGKAFGIFGAVAGAGAAVGLLLGGILTDYLSWRWCLGVNVALAAVTLAGGLAVLRGADPRRGGSVDVPGAVSVTGGMLLTVFGLSRAQTDGWGAASTVSCLVAGLALLVVFGLVQSRVRAPLLPLRVLADRNRAGAYTATFVVGAGMFGVFLFLTYYMQAVLRFDAVQAGLAFVPMALAIIAASTVSSVLLTPRASAKVVIPAGMLVAALGMLLFTRISVDGTYLQHVLPASLVFGLGLGTVFGFASNTATRQVDPDDAGVASAMVNVGQQIGAAVGTALLNTVAAAATSDYLAAHADSASGAPSAALQALAAVHGYALGFRVSAIIFAVGAALVAVLLRAGLLPGTTAEVAPGPRP